MDKKTKTTLIIFLIVVFLIGLIDATSLFKQEYNDKLPDVITSQSWKGKGNGDTQTIYFKKEGEFGYYCACGSPVDNYDLCDSYKYNAKTKTIKLNCFPGAGITKIKIVKSTDAELVLDFGGEKRKFKTEYYHTVENPLPFAGLKFQSTNGDKYTLEFTKYGNYEAYNSTKKEYDLGSEVCFTWYYKKDSNEITLDCQEEEGKIEIKKYDEAKKELELYFPKEKKTIKFVETKGDE